MSSISVAVAPKYWAPFVLMGDDVKIELGGKKSH